MSGENLEDKELEEGECSENESDDISDKIILDVSTNSESDDEEQGLLFVYSMFFLMSFFIATFVTTIIMLHMYLCASFCYRYP